MKLYLTGFRVNPQTLDADRLEELLSHQHQQLIRTQEDCIKSAFKGMFGEDIMLHLGEIRVSCDSVKNFMDPLVYEQKSYSYKGVRFLIETTRIEQTISEKKNAVSIVTSFELPR